MAVERGEEVVKCFRAYLPTFLSAAVVYTIYEMWFIWIGMAVV